MVYGISMVIYIVTIVLKKVYGDVHCLFVFSLFKGWPADLAGHHDVVFIMVLTTIT